MLVERLGVELGVLGVGVVDARAELAQRAQPVDPEEGQVRWVEAEAKRRRRDGLEEGAPVGRRGREVAAGGGVVLHHDLDAELLGVRADRRHPQLRAAQRLLVRRAPGHDARVRDARVAELDEGDLLPGGLVDARDHGRDVPLPLGVVGHDQRGAGVDRGDLESGLARDVDRVVAVVRDVDRAVAVLGRPAAELGEVDLGAQDAGQDDSELQPLIPVSVMPWMKVRWTKKKRMMIGSVTQTDIAIISPHSVSYS